MHNLTVNGNTVISSSGSIQDSSVANGGTLTFGDAGTDTLTLRSLIATQNGTIVVNAATTVNVSSFLSTGAGSGSIQIGSVSGDSLFVMDSGNLSLNGDINLTNPCILIINSSGDINGSAHSIAADTLLLEGSGSTILNNSANNIGVIASSRNGSFELRNSSSMQIASRAVNSTIAGVNINRSVNGITTNGQDIAVETINGNLTVAAPVSSGPAAGGDILLIANNSAGPIVYSDLNITDFVNAGTGNMLLMGDPVNLGANLKGAHLNVTRSIVLTAHAYLEFSGNLLDFTCTIDSNNDPAGPWNFILAADAATTHVDFRDNIGVRAGYSRVNDLIINAHTVSLQAPLSAISLAGNLFISAAGSFFNNTARAVTLDVEGSVSGAGTLIAGNSSINIGGELSITTFNCGTSTVTFDTGTDVSLNSYIFHNMVINKPGGSITSTGSIVVSNSLTMSAGTWNASPFPSTFMHIITGGWDSRGITFNAGGSAIRLLGTDPIFFTSGLGEPFYNLITENNRTLGSNVAVSQNLLIQAGTLSVNNHTLDVEGSVAGGGGGPGVPPGALHGGNGHIYIGGNLQLDSARFHCGTSTITFDTDQNSIIPRTVYHNIVVAKDGPGTGTNNNVITLMGPWSAANLSISQGRLYANGDLTVTGTVRLKSSTPAGLPVLDMLNHNFNFAGYDASPGAGGVHEGELRLTGEQAQQTMPVLGASFERYGLITYYAGSSNGAIRMAHFWNLTVDAAGRLIYLNNPVTVYGSSNPYGNGTLATPVTGAGLNGLRISNGIFICAAPANTITLYGSFIVSGLATYVHSDSSLVFMGNAPSYIAGNNLYHKFIADDASVAGKIFYIQNGRSFTLPDDPSAEVRIHGTNLHPPGGSLMPPPLSFPSPRSYVYLVSAAPGSPPLYWLFNKQAAAVVDLQYVYLLHSDASAHPQVVPPDVETEYCPGWIRTVFVEQSWTQDVNSNGRIDRIVVEAGPALNMNFTSFTAEVDGYTVLNYDHPAAMPSNQFAIELEEGAYLDTGVTPAWRIVSNNSLRDTTINGLLSLYNGILPSIPVAKSEEIPYDEAPPLIGYTLAAADKNEIFVHFSEPVIQTGGLTEIAAGNFNTAAGGGIASLRRVSPSPAPGNQGMRELLLITNTDISAADIAGGAVSLAVNSGAIEDFASPSSTHVFDATDPPDTGNALFSLNHRISDVGLGIAGNGIVEPVFARASGTPAAGGSGPGMVTRFDGSEFLEEEDFVLQAHRYSGLGFNPQLVYANAIPSMYRNGALWLPSFTETSGSGNFSGLVPRPFSGTLSGAGSLNGNLIDYTLNASDPMVMYGKNFEFFFYNAAADLYMGRLEDDTASNWYRGVRPWIIPINEVALQAGGVTIMNNVINPSQNELVSLSYVVKSDGMATVQVFDLSGDLVEVLQRGYQEAGKYFVSWNGRNRSGRIVARGIYFIRFVGPGGIDQVRKVLVIK
ncbi:MAG: hypothetical protein CSA76_04020 [Spirochaetales bacterium]|nr:MAG: hypothetical protein CSA76_04020 [Spirochaetales bacterium]